MSLNLSEPNRGGRFRRLTRGTISVGLAIALTPTVFAAGPRIETTFFPVTTHARVLEPHADQDRLGIRFSVRFEKLRGCEFLGLAWYDGDYQLRVEFEPYADEAPRTRPPGRQATGPWRIGGIRTLEGTHAWALHRCHPLWVTFTEFYRG